MRHRKDQAKLGRPHAHRRALVHSLVRSLFLYDRVRTTLAKAKAAQRLAERLVSRSQRNDLAARRYVYVHLGDHELVKHLFEEVRPRFEDRTSGFTRVFLLGNRPGDGAEMAILEMSLKGEPKKKPKPGTKKAQKPAPKAQAKPKAKKKETKQEKPSKEKKEEKEKKKASKAK